MKLELSFEKFTLRFEGDSGTGHAVNRAVNQTLGSLMDVQNRVIDVTAHEGQRALPAASTPTAVPKRRRPRPRPGAINGEGSTSQEADSDGESPQGKTSRSRRPQSQGFRAQTYRLLSEGYLSSPRSAAEIKAALSKRGFTFDIKNIASELTDFTKKEYLVRDKNDDGKYAYVKGPNNDYRGSQGGS
jgi:hypothetical protein